jgi:hypothetical protein
MIYKFGLAADIHDDGAGSSYAVLETIKAFHLEHEVDATFILGDLMNYYSSGDAQIISQQFADNTFWILGDHDGAADSVTDMATIQSIETTSGDFRRDFGNITLLCFTDIQPGGMVISDITLAWLDSQLMACVGRYVFLMCHAPIVANGAGEIGGVFCSNPEALMSSITAAQGVGVLVRALLFGHVHGSSYTPPLYDYNSHVYFYGVAAGVEGDNAGVIEIDDSDGSFTIVGLGTQKDFSNINNGITYVPYPAIGLISMNDEAQYSTLAQLLSYIEGYSNIEQITIEGSPIWSAVTADQFIGSIVYYLREKTANIVIGGREYHGAYTITNGVVKINCTEAC